MTFGNNFGNHNGPSWGRWSRLDHARTIGLHSLAFPGLTTGATFLFPSRGEHAGPY
ncbi:hypothetical protein PEP31012_02185 [Pandoraea eparura]|uniref:Uncharacterized protein n=1 Tax=Pandoraea eparura TaxID=2508291 RepID=A0A5E4UU27_9BURK|nr:hypothetical protein PEP31012_02185 [Pandoraea eparura]